MIVHHRINDYRDLKNIPKEDAIEIDIRWSYSRGLIVTHDLDDGLNSSFNDWIKYFDHAALFLNIKESQCEDKIIELYNTRFDFHKWFFLDSQLPDIIRLSNLGYQDKFIFRYSRNENPLKSLVEKSAPYVWIDDFGYYTPYTNFDKIDGKIYIYCSPELHKRDDILVNYINNFETKFGKQNDSYGICTDYPKIWKLIC